MESGTSMLEQAPSRREVGLYFIVDSNVKPAFGLSVGKYVNALFGSVWNYMQHQKNNVPWLNLVGIHELEESMTESLLVNSVEHNMIMEQERGLLVNHAIDRFHKVYQRKDTTKIPHAYIVLTRHPIYNHEGVQLDAWAKICAICRYDNYVFVQSTGYFQEIPVLLRHVLKM
ncbi:uncharacterized protein LOC120845955 [Ixodes scapularis]|uniref:uncharacterized protein LOC120845955 n=1 Tax=Ixodes scapularis TaxID=6945 RepID=UPI001A9CF1C6|nr:uncharacterized protein LOC120845955 [Ixodes scapularis]